MTDQDLASTVLDAAGKLIVVLDSTGRVVLFNAACARLTGYTATEMQGRPVWERLQPAEEREQIAARFARLRPESFPRTLQVTWITRTGQPQRVLWTQTAITDSAEGLAYVVGIGTALDDPARVVNLQQSEERFAIAFRASSDALLIVNFADGCIMEVNSCWQRVTGFDADEVVNRPLRQLEFGVAAADRRRILALLRRDGHVHDAETQFRRKSGEVRQAIISIELIPVGGEPCLLVIGRDVTEQQQAEVALRESERQFRAVFETALDAMYIFDDSGHIGDANPAAFAASGVSSPALLGLHFSELAPPGTQEEFAALWRAFQLHGRLRGEFPVPARDGGIRYLEFNTIRHFLPGRNLAVVRDITARKQMEKTLRRALALEQELSCLAQAEAARLAGLQERQATFVTTITHSLRTPFTALRAGLGLVETSMDARLRPDERHLLGTVRRNIGRVGMLIDDLLALNQVEVDALTLETELLDLRAVIAEALEVIHPLIREKGQRLEVALPLPLPHVGDARHLEQVLVNLLDNAHRHTPAGTRILISGRRAGEMLEVAISDNGPGIPAEQRELVFQRFQRGDTSEGGLGLGLAIARTMIELHGGHIWLEAQPGGGAVFRFSLPASPAGEDGLV